MCGFAGLLRPGGLEPDDPARLAAADAALAHRGPDGAGVWTDPSGRLRLHHRRLAIRDPFHGAQPFLGRARGTVLAWNGEVYNADALRRRLEDRGHRFEGTGDTEVVSALLEEDGPAGLPSIEGMYAIAWWDARAATLLLAADPNGEKPLLLAEGPDGTVLFASEMRALLASDLVPRRLDGAATAVWLAMGHAPAPSTVLRGVVRLPPGAAWTWDAAGRRTARGRVVVDGLPGEAPPAASFGQAVDEVESALAGAVARQMVADRPLAVLLSGGVDSGLLAAFAARARAGVHTLTIAFRGSPFDEAALAERVAAAHGTTHETIEADAGPEGFLPAVGDAMDEPLADGAFYPLLALCRAASRRATVLLGGEGGDELFLGYDGWRADWGLRATGGAARAAARIAGSVWPRGARGGARLARLAETEVARARRLAAPRLDDPRGAWRIPVLLDPAPVRGLLDAEFPPGSIRTRSEGIRATRRWALRASLASGLLVKGDRASMAASVELRAPFLDRTVRRLALSLPLEHLVDAREGKRVLRAVFARYAPPGHARLPKMGLRPPLAAWLRGPLRACARDTLLDPAAPTRALFDRQGVAALLERHVTGPGDWHDEILTLLVLDAWMRRHRILAP